MDFLEFLELVLGPFGALVLAVGMLAMMGWFLKHSLKLQEKQAENYTQIAVSIADMAAILRSCKLRDTD